MVMTNSLPALLAGLMIRPGWLGAFLGGFLASALVGSRFEQQFPALLEILLPGGDSIQERELDFKSEG